MSEVKNEDLIKLEARLETALARQEERSIHIENSLKEIKATLKQREQREEQEKISVILLNNNLSMFIEESKRRFGALEDQAEKNQLRDNTAAQEVQRVSMLYEEVKQDILGESTKGQPNTLIERVGETETSLRDLDGRIRTLEKQSFQNYERLTAIGSYEEYMNEVKQIYRFLGRWNMRIKNGKTLLIQFLHQRQQKLAEAIAQSVVLRLLIAFVAALGTSPVWLEIVNEIVKIIMK